MLAIHVRFLHGVVRAGSHNDNAFTGLEDEGEWPPSPARLFSALVAAAGTGSRSVIGDDSELELLESADPPQIVADRDSDVLRSHLVERFVVVDERHTDNKTGTTRAVQEYVARSAAKVRPGTRMAPKTPEMTYMWPELTPTRKQLESIAARAARVGYLGCSDSPVALRVTCEANPESEGRLWVAEGAGQHALPVPYPGFRQALDAAYEQWLKGPMRRAWIPTRLARYAAPGELTATAPSPPQVFWMLLEPAVSGRFALAVTQTLRAATLDLYERIVGEEPPAVLHGHGFDRSGRNHAQFLALPDVGSKHSSGRLHGAAVWLPSETPDATVANVRSALAHLRELCRPGWFSVGVRPHGGEQRPWSASPLRWSRASRRWVSALPAVHERWSDSGPDRAEVERWFRHAGFDCSVVDSRNSYAPLLSGAVRLRPEQVHREGRSRHPYSFFEVELDREIAGPVVIGRGRPFGMGLMAPGD